MSPNFSKKFNIDFSPTVKEKTNEKVNPHIMRVNQKVMIDRSSRNTPH